MQRTAFLGLVAIAIVLSGLAATAHAAPDPRASTAMVSSLPGPDQARAWLEDRRATLLAELERGTEAVKARIEAWRAVSGYLARTGGLKDHERGYIIYPPRVTLALFLLDRAEAMYAAALDAKDPAGLPTVDDLFRLGGERLHPSAAEKYPTVARARAALDALAVPSEALRGFRVFLLPFAMGEVSGQGGPGFTFLAAEPRDEKLIANQLEVTLAHEFGHHLHLAGMPRETWIGRLRWQDYLDLRGLSWRDDGRVKTEEWSRSPEETFAEDFRLLFGGRSARQEPAATGAGDPRQRPQSAARLRRFISGLAAMTRPPAATAPWPEG